jgi:hypothetical protein
MLGKKVSVRDRLIYARYGAVPVYPTAYNPDYVLDADNETTTYHVTRKLLYIFARGRKYFFYIEFVVGKPRIFCGNTLP